jgi:hypothetical protein
LVVFLAVDVTLGFALFLRDASWWPSIVHQNLTFGTVWDVAPFGTQVVVASTFDVTVVVQVLAGEWWAVLDTWVILFTVLTHDGTEVRFPEADVDALLCALMCIGRHSGTQALAVTARVTGARVVHTPVIPTIWRYNGMARLEGFRFDDATRFESPWSPVRLCLAGSGHFHCGSARGRHLPGLGKVRGSGQCGASMGWPEVLALIVVEVSTQTVDLVSVADL